MAGLFLAPGLTELLTVSLLPLHSGSWKGKGGADPTNQLGKLMAVVLRGSLLQGRVREVVGVQ